jgi:2,3-bisphosphoglycerate-independent phosphoglycerate mutase
MKVLLIVCDGMGDRPLESLGGKTPLEAAETPNLDALVSRGECGICDPIRPGVRAGSDTSHLAILGYDPYTTYTGRGPFEAAGLGLELQSGDVAFRCNFATMDASMTVTDRRAGRIKDTSALAEVVREIDVQGAEILFRSFGYRGVLVLRGEGLSDQVPDTDPHLTGERVHRATALDGSEAAERTARILNEFVEKSHQVLKDHPLNAQREKEGRPPANIVLTRGGGMAPDLEPFREKTGLQGACMATTAIIKGMGKLSGMEVMDVKPDYAERMAQALDVLEEKDLVLMNIKEADEAGHDNDPERKVRVLEEIDQALEPLMDFAKDNYLIVMADHSTPCSVQDHSGDPVPLMFLGPGVRTDSVTAFNERACAHGGLNRIRARDVMPILLNLMNKSEKFGA